MRSEHEPLISSDGSPCCLARFISQFSNDVNDGRCTCSALKDKYAMNIRPTKPEDIFGLKEVLDSTGIFPSEMLPEMVSSFFDDLASTDQWLTCEHDGKVVGFCYASLEQMTENTWNMLAIAVHASVQGGGCGSAIVGALENALRSRGGRLLIVDTSGKDEFAQTRAFYRKNGYAEEARIRDFWSAGDDKIVFWKRLL